ncbi:protein kinase domain-containing protein [Calothrix sp. PCC 6303]|uniref:protein kinase domain-containing protein n=1 Tax=Calothrix sp. PCC 6303 TaxID=1170562 RepID=UPI0002A0520B|nr:RDD family protein [Calothrix sp. PCC 6303]AFY99798.1 serine/threonine protein kinase [Calothrix sp. PCC 6303]
MSGNNLIGSTLRGRYYITDKLGEGGIGETFLALDRDQPGNYKCVIKRLKPQNSSQSAIRWLQQSFQREATTLQRLGTHDQIPRLLAFFEENQEFFLVQEFIDGNMLRAEFSLGKQWSESQVIYLMRDILEVLSFVHQQSVIHRDLKPENLIRRGSDRKIILIDFGAVKEISTQVFNTQGQIVATTFVIGTPGYMPVEQLQQNAMLCSDIYAVGMIGIEALTGIFPTNLLDSYSGQINWRLQAQVRPEVADILDTMIAYHPSQRYQSASVALEAILELTNTVQKFPTPIPIPIPTPIPSRVPAITSPSPGIIKYAGFSRRIAAYCIDFCILIIASLLLDLSQSGVPTTGSDGEFLGRIIGYYIMLGFLYCPVMESFQTQATLGKMALGIMVTDIHGQRISWGQATKRHVSKLVSYITFFIGFFMGGFTKEKQTLHDKISKCLVVRKD